MNVHFARRPALGRTATRRQSAFTLIEIMIVVLIIGLLAMVAIPNVNRALQQARLKAIQVNLSTIDNVKQQWAGENKKGDDVVPTESDLAPYFRGSKFPASVVGETYQINAVGQQPTAVTPTKLLDVPSGGTITIPDK